MVAIVARGTLNAGVGHAVVTFVKVFGFDSTRNGSSRATERLTFDFLRRFGRLAVFAHIEVGVVHGTRSATTGFGHKHNFGHVTELELDALVATLGARQASSLTGEEFVPLVEVGLDIDVAALTGSRTDAEDLQEGGGTRLGWFLVTDVGMDGVSSTVNREFALLGTDVVGARLAVPVVHDVVFHLRIHGPTVNTDVTILGRTRLGVLIVGSVLHAADALTRAVITVTETHTSQEVSIVSPASFESTVVVVLHGVAATLGPLFEAPLGAADGTRLVAVHIVSATAGISHLILTGIDSESRRCQTESQNNSSLENLRIFNHIYNSSFFRKNKHSDVKSECFARICVVAKNNTMLTDFYFTAMRCRRPLPLTR